MGRHKAVGTGAVRERLQSLGLDIKFLEWLEGPQDRLPRFQRVHEVESDDFAGAIRGASWLSQFGYVGDVLSPQEEAAWRGRYAVLLDFLVAGLRHSLSQHQEAVAKDLECVERVLELLLPRTAWASYRRDIQLLRRTGHPRTDPHSGRRRRRGGHEETEETQRIRAAIEYLKSGGSSCPFKDLAECWNALLDNRGDGGRRYDPGGIRSRLRKGFAGCWLAFWRRVYEGDMRDVFPSRFPLSSELEKRESEVQEQRFVYVPR